MILPVYSDAREREAQRGTPLKRRGLCLSHDSSGARPSG